MCQGAGRFRRPLHVAMQLGLALHPLQAGAWRIVSEDSGTQNERRPFLLIACTERIVTALAGEYRRILRCSSK